MNDPFLSRVKALQTLALILRKQQEIAEAAVAELGNCIDLLSASGLVPKSVILGPVLLAQSYEEGAGPPDGSQTVQAAVTIPGGVGVIRWDTEEYLAICDEPEGPETYAPLHFVPFDDCEAAIKALLLPHLFGLVEEFCDRLPHYRVGDN